MKLSAARLEIDPEVDFDSRRAVYFRQMRYGLFVSGKDYEPFSHLTFYSGPYGTACYGDGLTTVLTSAKTYASSLGILPLFVVRHHKITIFRVCLPAKHNTPTSLDVFGIRYRRIQTRVWHLGSRSLEVHVNSMRYVG